jgi:hypothetical protein
MSELLLWMNLKSNQIPNLFLRNFTGMTMACCNKKTG